MFHLYEVSKIVRLIETASRMVVAKDWRKRRMGGYCLMGTEFHLGMRKRSGNGYGEYTWYHWTVHLKIIKMENSMLNIFYQNINTHISLRSCVFALSIKCSSAMLLYYWGNDFLFKGPILCGILSPVVNPLPLSCRGHALWPCTLGSCTLIQD